MLARDESRTRHYPDHGGSGGVAPPGQCVQEAGMAVAPRAVLAVFVATSPLLLPAPADAAVYYRAQTTATAVHLRLTQEPAGSIITASLFDDAIAYAASDFETSGGSEALAAPAFPGKLVTQGPGMLCTQIFECPTDPPDYPLLADASYPRRQHDSVAASDGPLGAGPIALTPSGSSTALPSPSPSAVAQRRAPSSAGPGCCGCMSSRG
jgi:hypothetical protein